mgnify:CR=1 FL=1
MAEWATASVKIIDPEFAVYGSHPQTSARPSTSQHASEVIRSDQKSLATARSHHQSIRGHQEGYARWTLKLRPRPLRFPPMCQLLPDWTLAASSLASSSRPFSITQSSEARPSRDSLQLLASFGPPMPPRWLPGMWLPPCYLQRRPTRLALRAARCVLGVILHTALHLARWPHVTHAHAVACRWHGQPSDSRVCGGCRSKKPISKRRRRRLLSP